MDGLKIDNAFRDKERRRVLKLYSPSKHSPGFADASALVEWWLRQLKRQNGCCVYCEVSVVVLQELIQADLLRGRGVRGTGLRGRNFELERIDANQPYGPENCALACYYCNNDKSYIYSAEDYKKFFAPAKKAHFDFLVTKLKKRAA